MNSAALRADGAESLACAYLTLATLLGVVVFGWWCAEYVAALVLALLVLREAREAYAEAREADEGEDADK